MHFKQWFASGLAAFLCPPPPPHTTKVVNWNLAVLYKDCSATDLRDEVVNDDDEYCNLFWGREELRGILVENVDTPCRKDLAR